MKLPTLTLTPRPPVVTPQYVRDRRDQIATIEAFDIRTMRQLELCLQVLRAAAETPAAMLDPQKFHECARLALMESE